MTSSGFFGPLSKKQLQSKLNQPWVSGPNYCTKSCAVADIAVRVHKLGVIEQVEEFGAELKLGRSLTAVSLSSARSKSLIPGPQQTVRGESPMMPS